jgi:hypothetical protein
MAGPGFLLRSAPAPPIVGFASSLFLSRCGLTVVCARVAGPWFAAPKAKTGGNVSSISVIMAPPAALYRQVVLWNDDGAITRCPDCCGPLRPPVAIFKMNRVLHLTRMRWCCYPRCYSRRSWHLVGCDCHRLDTNGSSRGLLVTPLVFLSGEFARLRSGSSLLLLYNRFASVLSILSFCVLCLPFYTNTFLLFLACQRPFQQEV